MERIFAFHRAVAPLIMEAVVLGFFSLILFLATSLVPIVGFALSLFAPLPLTLLSVRRGLAGGVLGLLFLFLLLALSSSLLRAVSFLLEFGGVAVILGEGIRREWGGERAVLLGALGSGAGTSLLLLIHMLRFRVGLSDLIDKQITERLLELREIFAKAGAAPTSWDSLEHFLLQSYPALLFLSILFAAILNYYLARRIRGWRNPDAKQKDRPFSDWSIPEYWVWGFIFSLLLYLLPTPYKLVGLNLLLISSGLYLLQGMAISLTFLRRWHLPTLLKVSIFLFALSQPVFLLLFAGIGLFDVWGNFRRGLSGKSTSEG